MVGGRITRSCAAGNAIVRERKIGAGAAATTHRVSVLHVPSVTLRRAPRRLPSREGRRRRAAAAVIVAIAVVASRDAVAHPFGISSVSRYLGVEIAAGGG